MKIINSNLNINNFIILNFLIPKFFKSKLLIYMFYFAFLFQPVLLFPGGIINCQITDDNGSPVSTPICILNAFIYSPYYYYPDNFGITNVYLDYYGYYWSGSYVSYNSDKYKGDISSIDGKYTFTNVSTGWWKLQNSKYESKGTNYFSDYQPSRYTKSETGYIFVEDGKTYNLNLTLLRKGTVTGYILSHSSNPVENCSISAGENTGSTNSSGFFMIDKMPVGKSLIHVTPPSNSDFVTGDYGEVNIISASTSTIKIFLNTKGNISGKIIDENNNPVSKAYISFSYWDNYYHELFFYTTDLGTYSITGLNPGDYTIYIIPPLNSNLIKNEYHFTIKAGEELIKDIKLTNSIEIPKTENGNLYGFVQDDYGNLLTNKRIYIDYYKSCIISSSGTYKIVEITPGKYDINVQDYYGNYYYENYSIDDYRFSLIILPGDNNYNFILPTKGSIRGKITDNNGNPVKNCQLTLNPLSYSFFTNDIGEFFFPKINPFNYSLTVNPSKDTGLVSQTIKNIFVSYKSTTTINITLGSISLTNTNSSGIIAVSILEKGVDVTAPSGTFAKDVQIVASFNPNTDDITNSNKTENLPENTKILQDFSEYIWDITAYSIEDETELNISAGKKLNISLPYPDKMDIDKVKNLRIFRLNNNKKWELVNGAQKIDTSNKKISMDIEHLSYYRILYVIPPQAISKTLIRVYPNPVDFTKSVRGTLKFDKLPANPTLSIYDISGRLIKEIKPIADNIDLIIGKAEWDGKNSENDYVSPGIYIYKVTNSSGFKQVGKFGITKNK